VAGPKLRDELVAHRLIREEIIALARKKPRDCNLVILVRLDAELAAMMTIRYESLVELLHGERERQVLRVTVPDVAHKAMKYSI